MAKTYAVNLDGHSLERGWWGSRLRAQEMLRDIPFPALLLTSVYLAIYLLWQAFGGVAHRSLIGDLAYLPITTFAVILALRAARRCAPVSRARAAWTLIAIALVSYGLGDIVQLYYEVGAGSYPSPSIGDIFYLGFYPLFLLGVLRFPRSRAVSAGDRVRAALDAVTIGVGAATVVWYVVLGPAAYSDTGNLLSTIVTISYPAGDIVLIVALLRMMMDVRLPSMRPSLRLLTAGVAIFVLTDIAYGWLVLHASYMGGDPVDIGWMLATAAFALAAAAQQPIDRQQSEAPDLPNARNAAEPIEGERAPGLSAALPYLAVAAVFALMIASQTEDAFFPDLSLVVISVLVGVLVSVRQYLAQRELTHAHRELRATHDELAALATTDPLTGLPNHRALVTAIDQELERSARFGRSCALLFIDIDHFKELNDGWGHEAGDAALRELGEVLQEALRTMDTAGRWGGEEFVVVLPEVDEDAALTAGERVRAQVAEHLFQAGGSTRLTVSVGVACCPRDGVTRNAVLTAADRAMYAAKWLGRNQTFSAADPVVGTLGSAANGEAYAPDDRSMMGAVDALAMLVDARDKGTGNHTIHVARLAQRVALQLGCTPQQAREVFLAAKLHDIGKVAVADAVLRKPGKLTDEEWELMRLHPEIGADVVSRIGRLAELAPIIRSHHERYDGNGYPSKLRGEQIPLEARIIGVADAFDAMISDRPYRPGLSLAAARAELRRGAGTQFDPAVIAAIDRLLDDEQQETDAHADAVTAHADALSAPGTPATPSTVSAPDTPATPSTVAAPDTPGTTSAPRTPATFSAQSVKEARPDAPDHDENWPR